MPAYVLARFYCLAVCTIRADQLSPGGGSPVPSSTTSTTTTSIISYALAGDTFTTCTDIEICRTRYSIIWSSLVTILACVWTAVHRNIPGPAKAEESQLRRFVVRVLEVVQIVVVTLLVPEWVLAWAVRQFLSARRVGRELEEARVDAERAWNTKRCVDGDSSANRERPKSWASWNGDVLLTHRCIGQMAVNDYSLGVDKCVGRLDSKWTTRHGFFVIMGGFHYYENGEPQHPLSRFDVVKLVETGNLVPPTEDEIRGWSQGDALSKGLAIVQTLWFVVQCVARRVEDLPITQLEVMTLAYTTITVVMYIAWWSKPQNVGGPVRVAVKTFPEPKPLREFSWYWRVFYIISGAHDVLIDLTDEPCVPTFYGGCTYGGNGADADIVALAVAMVFGAVHCAAWNYAFPSHVEGLIWRVSSSAIVALPGTMLLIILPLWGLEGYTGVLQRILLPLFIISGPIYIAARMFLLALSFTTLRSLPYKAYQAVQWTLLIPHFT
ncbi:hypothetical protein BV25DRAFT_1915899 [Artomyces pyxidatus]|uniref:Uncharacterized protein n=1 Tax=Artomyces pyxidatus TaxID=48021 RepID=A0ACB8T3R3_9AGAM|nr:hypothetical protein BV25DRAFT_1915899 [Artomyces pyxidatus]